LCRALLATGLTKLGWREDQIPPVATELLESLSGVLPEYELPASLTVAHSRHYMPTSGKTTKVLDAFAHTGARELSISWAVKLTDEARALLGELVEAMSYLGRAESWVEGRVEPGVLERTNCRPGVSPELEGDAEPVTLLAPMPSAAYMMWRSELLADQPALASGGKRSRSSSKPQVPDGIVGCLLQSTTELQRQGWNHPPGSRRVVYHRPSETLVASQPRASRPRRSARPPVEYALLALRSHARHGGALPRHRHAITQMEIVHGALSKKLEHDGDGGPCPELIGTRGDG
ncbi:MAG: type I-U CRISPR-associated protein Cas5/Cas6, partial [Myxococcales bacterium]|nr:type I-U CRISPR-associated protein Cas5/Cas6 [Myxococcales bacterium]